MTKQFIPENMRGRVFDNRQDRRSTKGPDFSGTATVNGRLVRVAQWFNPPDERHPKGSFGIHFENEDDYQDRRAQEAGAKAARQPGAPQPHPPRQGSSALPSDEPDDDIPF